MYASHLCFVSFFSTLIYIKHAYKYITTHINTSSTHINTSRTHINTSTHVYKYVKQRKQISKTSNIFKIPTLRAEALDLTCLCCWIACETISKISKRSKNPSDGPWDQKVHPCGIYERKCTFVDAFFQVRSNTPSSNLPAIKYRPGISNTF